MKYTMTTSRPTVRLGSLKMGDVFEVGRGAYMKSDEAVKTDPGQLIAMSLNANGRGVLVNFSADMIVAVAVEVVVSVRMDDKPS